MKLKFESKKDSRFKKVFSYVELNLKSKISSWRENIILSGNNVFLYDEQSELRRNGLPNFFDSTLNSRHSNIIKGKTLRGLKRKVARIKKFLPDKTEVTFFSRYYKCNVTGRIRNKNYEKPDIKFELRKSFEDFSYEHKNFDLLVSRLRQEGYLVSVYKEETDNYWVCEFNGHNIRGSFCTLNDYSYSCLSGKVSADDYHNFDKWSRCPLCLTIPINEQETKFLIEKLKYVGSELYEESKDYIEINEYEI